MDVAQNQHDFVDLGQNKKISVYFLFWFAVAPFWWCCNLITTSIVPALAIAVAPVVAGSMLRSQSAVQGCDPGAGSCQKCLSMLWHVVERRGKAWGCRSKGLSSHAGIHSSFKAVGSRMEGPHLPFPCLFQLPRSIRAFPLFPLYASSFSSPVFLSLKSMTCYMTRDM